MLRNIDPVGASAHNYGVVNAKKAFLLIAIILHMLMDIFPGLYQRNVVPLWAVELWAAIWAIVIVFIAVKLYRKLKTLSDKAIVARHPFLS